MIYNELINILNGMNSNVVILNDEDIDPIEIYLFTEKPGILRKALMTTNLFVEDNDRKRIIRVNSIQMFNNHHYITDLISRGKLISNNVYEMSINDQNAFWLYYTFIYTNRENWLCRNIQKNMMFRIQSEDSDELLKYLMNYIYENHYYIKVKNKKHWSLIRDVYSPLQRIYLNVSILLSKIKRKLPLRVLSKRVKLHRKLTTRRYIKRLENTKIIINWHFLKKKDGGAGGCVFIISDENDKKYFIKGNELSLYKGISNEISVQEYLKRFALTKNWYLGMTDHDIHFKWIKYPFIECITLNNYLNSFKLTLSDKEKLGVFLLEILDNLFSLDIIHNDLRCENIMVISSENSNVERYLLFDFGCSSYAGKSPWNIDTYWGAYFAESVCGISRFSDQIVDDAAAAYEIYRRSGGDMEDQYAIAIKDRIGRLFYKNTI